MIVELPPICIKMLLHFTERLDHEDTDFLEEWIKAIRGVPPILLADVMSMTKKQRSNVIEMLKETINSYECKV